MANEIKNIRLKDDAANVLHPETDWSLILNKPEIPEIPDVSVTVTGTGNAVTSASATGHSITLTKGTTFLTSHQDISGKEDKSNKVTSWSSTTTDAHYPSEKLVKTALDEKVPTHSTGTSIEIEDEDGNAALYLYPDQVELAKANDDLEARFVIEDDSAGVIHINSDHVGMIGVGLESEGVQLFYMDKNSENSNSIVLDAEDCTLSTMGTSDNSIATKKYVNDEDTSTLNSAKSYAEELISGLGAILRFKGTKATVAEVKAITQAEVGDVYIVTADGSEWVCKEKLSGMAKASAWEEFGHTQTGTVVDPDYSHITVSATNGVSDANGNVYKYVLPSDVVHDSSYKHISVTTSSVSDGTNTFNKYTHPENYTVHSSGLYKIANDKYGHVSEATAVVKSDITALGIPGQDTTYSAGEGLKLTGTTFSSKLTYEVIS